MELAFRISELFGFPIEAVLSREPFRPSSEAVYGPGVVGKDALGARSGDRP